MMAKKISFQIVHIHAKHLFVALFIGWLMLFSLPPASAQTVETLDCARDDFPPYGFKENGELKGIEVEVFHEIGRRLGIQTNLGILPWKRILLEMERGDIDCMMAAFKTDERLEYMDYTNVPIHVSSLVFFVHKENPIQFRTLEDLKGRKIGLVRGFATSPEFDTAVQDGWFTIVGGNTMEDNFKMLDYKMIDTVLVNSHVGNSILKKMGYTSIIALPTPLTASSAYITFSKKRNLVFLVPQFDAVLSEMFTDGTYHEIMQKYIRMEE